jgi:hypothetical protein
MLIKKQSFKLRNLMLASITASSICGFGAQASQPTETVLQDISVPMPVLIAKESAPTKDDADDIVSKEILVKSERTDQTLSEDYENATNNILNGVLDSLSAEIGNVEVSNMGGKKSISAQIAWKTNGDSIHNSAKEVFSFKRSFQTSGSDDALINSKIDILYKENSNNHNEEAAYDLLLNNKVSLILVAGEFNEKITIGSAHRNNDEELLYTLITANSGSPQNLFIEGETNAVTIEEIPNDTFKLIRELQVIIELERVDTGRTFRIILANKEL